MRKRWLRATLVGSIGVHVLALYWPRVDVPGTLEGGDKLTHVLLFGVPVLAAVLALRRPWLVVALLTLHAPLSEWAQSALLPDRSGDPADVAADAVGVMLGVTGGLLARRRGSPRALVD